MPPKRQRVSSATSPSPLINRIVEQYLANPSNKLTSYIIRNVAEQRNHTSRGLPPHFLEEPNLHKAVKTAIENVATNQEYENISKSHNAAELTDFLSRVFASAPRRSRSAQPIRVCPPQTCDDDIVTDSYELSNEPNSKLHYYRICDRKYCTNMTNRASVNVRGNQPLNLYDSKKQLTPEAINLIRLFYRGVKDQNAENIDENFKNKRWADNDTNSERIFKEMFDYLDKLKFNIGIKMTGDKYERAIAFLATFREHLTVLKSTINSTRPMPEFIPVFYPFSAKIDEKASYYPIDFAVFRDMTIWDLHIVWLPAYIWTKDKLTTKGDTVMHVWNAPVKSDVKKGTIDGFIELYRLHTYINYFPGPRQSDITPATIELATRLFPDFEVRVGIHLPSKILSHNAMSASPHQSQSMDVDFIQQITVTDVTNMQPYKVVLSACDTYHDFGAVVKPTFYNTNKTVLDRAVGQLGRGDNFKKLVEGVAVNGLKLEASVVNVYENTPDLSYLIESKLGNSSIPVATYDMTDTDSINYNSKYFILDTGHPIDDDNGRFASGIYAKSQTEQTNIMTTFLTNSFGTNCKLIVDRSTLLSHMYNTFVEYTGASLYDGAVKNNARVNPIEITASKGDGELFEIPIILVADSSVTIGNSQTRQMRNSEWQKCKPKVGKDPQIYFRNMKDCYDVDSLNFHLDLKRAGDAMQVLSCLKLQQQNPGTQYVFMTHDKLTMLHARLLKLNVMYSEIESRSRHRLIHVFRETMHTETKQEKYTRVYTALHQFFEKMATFQGKNTAVFTLVSLSHFKKLLEDLEKTNWKEPSFVFFLSQFIYILSTYEKFIKRLRRMQEFYGNYATQFAQIPSSYTNRHVLQSIESFYVNLKKELNGDKPKATGTKKPKAQEDAIEQIYTFEQAAEFNNFLSQVIGSFADFVKDESKNTNRFLETLSSLPSLTHEIATQLGIPEANLIQTVQTTVQSRQSSEKKSKLHKFIDSILRRLNFEAVKQFVRRPFQSGGGFDELEDKYHMIGDILLNEDLYNENLRFYMYLYGIGDGDVYVNRLLNMSYEQLNMQLINSYPGYMEEVQLEDLFSSKKPATKKRTVINPRDGAEQ